MSSRNSDPAVTRSSAWISWGFFLLFTLLTLSGFLDGLEVKTLDFRFRQRRTERIEEQVVLLYITDECIEKLGNWPWPRDYHAKAVDLLREGGARLIVFDVIFREADRTRVAEDASFVEACRKFGRVVFPLLIEQVKVLNPETLDLTTEYDVVKPFPDLASVALGMGFINVDYQNLNPDGIIRRLPLVMKFQDGVYPALDLIIATSLANQSFGTLGGKVLLGTASIPLVDVPGRDAPWQRERPIFDRAFLVNYLGEATSGCFQTAFFSDLVQGHLDPSLFKDKIVLIGPSALGLSDIKLTPYGEMPGVMIHANVAQNLLNQNFLYHPSIWIQIAILAFLALLTHLALVRLGPWPGTLGLAGVLGIYNGLAFLVFFKASLVLDMVGPTLLPLGQFISGRFWQMVNHLKAAYQSLKERTLELEHSNLLLDLQVQDLSSLNEASRRFASTLDMEVLGLEVLENFKDLCGASDGLLVFLEPDGDSCQALTQSGYGSEKASLFLFDPEVVKRTQIMIQTGKQVFDPDGRWFTRYVPLLMGSRVWGGVLVREITPTAESGDRDFFWATLSGLAATTLENARLYNLATVDTLTRLYVRRYFQFQIEQEFKRGKRYGHRLALLMTDIDHFKTFNDTYGHQQGDVVLREVAGVVKRSLREIDIAARYGGEEFGIILPETDLKGADIVAERIRRNVEQLLVPQTSPTAPPLRVTISLGVATFPECRPESSDHMIRLADQALYKAKEGGRNRVELAELLDPLPEDLISPTPETPPEES